MGFVIRGTINIQQGYRVFIEFEKEQELDIPMVGI